MLLQGYVGGKPVADVENVSHLHQTSPPLLQTKCSAKIVASTLHKDLIRHSAGRLETSIRKCPDDRRNMCLKRVIIE